jgi:hypothetical protein
VEVTAAEQPILSFEHLQNPFFGRVEQYAGNVVHPIVRMALAEQNQRVSSSWGEKTAVVH